MNQSYLENLPIEIKEQIFQYLSSSDVLNLALVSKNLNESVGNCRKCMEKYWIKFYTFNLKDLDSLENSCRHYVKLKINRVKTNDHFDYLINLNQCWKKVLVYNCEFQYAEKYLKLIKAIADHVEELEVAVIEILCYEEFEDVKIKFPALKRIMLRNMPSNTMEIFVKSCENLEVATFDIANEMKSFRPLREMMKEFLRNCKKLKHLQLGPNYIRALFGENEALNFEFQLTHLLLKLPIANDLLDVAYDQIVEFLRTQSKIEWIITMELLNDDILHVIWNELNSIKRASFIGLVELFELEMGFDLQPKMSITKLDLISRKVLISQLGKLLRAAPCVDCLHVCILNRHMMNTIARESFSVKNLFYEHIEEDVTEFYHELIKSDGNINRDIKLSQKSFWFENENPFSLDPIFWRI